MKRQERKRFLYPRLEIFETVSAVSMKMTKIVLPWSTSYFTFHYLKIGVYLQEKTFRSIYEFFVLRRSLFNIRTSILLKDSLILFLILYRHNLFI